MTKTLIPRIPPTQTVVRMMRRPVGPVVPGVDLVPSTEPTPDPAQLQPGEVLLHRLYLSLDPAMRGWMRDIPSYIPPVKVGAVMRGGTVCEVVHSRHEQFQTGDLVLDNSMKEGWNEFAVIAGKYCRKLPPLGHHQTISMTSYLSVLGITGLTAYFGLLQVGKPKAGETVLVSAAAGATGSVVCQIAKHVVGCKVVGIAGGRDKCRWLLEEAGCDAAIDYKLAQNPSQFQKQLRDALKKVSSRGVDVFFDNVGGYILNETLRRLNVKGRVVVCGAISAYNEDPRSTNIVAPTNYTALIPLRAKMEGFIVTDYAKQFKEARKNMAQWIEEGKLTFKEDIREGLERAPEHLQALFSGGNTGKLIVKIGDPITQHTTTGPALSKL